MIGILSDAHGNLAAFAKGWDLLKREGARRFVFLGDAVGYIPGWQVVDALMDRHDQVMCIMGNHEAMVLSGERSGHENVYRHEALRSTLTEKRRDFLTSWQQSVKLQLEGTSLLLVHGSPADPLNGYLYPDTDLTQFKVDQEIVVSGHTHRPFIGVAGRHRFVNVGSCGLPRDHGSLGSGALISADGKDIRIIRYDIREESAASLAAAGEVHTSVLGAFARRVDHPFGELIND